MDLRLVVLGLVDLEISGFAISGFVAAPTQTDESEFSDLRAQNLSFLRINIEVDKHFKNMPE